MTIALFVGDCDESLAIKAKSVDKSSYLVDTSNYEDFLTLNSFKANTTIYTSAADLPKISKKRCVFYEVLDKADIIYYCPPTTWSDHSNEFSTQSMQLLTEYFLYLLHNKKNNVQGLDLSKYSNNTYSQLNQSRSLNLDAQQLWVAGCSITAGTAVEQHEKFSYLLSKKFNNQFIDLSRAGSSIEYAADQILRSDVRCGDFVVWGLTSELRAPFWDRKNQQVQSLNLYGFDKKINKADDPMHETRLYKAIISYNQVENFCKKIGANLVTVPIICSEVLQLYLQHNECYYQLPYQPCFVDFGSDNLHPGPLQHQWYATQIENILKQWH